jgi:glycosyltransferase involved in cell wall biosynthesis
MLSGLRPAPAVVSRPQTADSLVSGRSCVAGRRLRVLMITEGTYPYAFGGVSTWCHALIKGLPEVDFWLDSLISDPHLELRFELPTNVVQLRTIPIWGVIESEEVQQFGWSELSRRRKTTRQLVQRQLVPLIEELLTELWLGAEDQPLLASLIHRLYRFGQHFDLNEGLRSEAVWKAFRRVSSECFPRVAEQHGFVVRRVALSNLTSGMQWLRHLLFPLARTVPEVDVAHAAMAGICSLVGVCAKLEHGAAFLLTEHGIYLREAYLAAAAGHESLFMKLLRLRFARRITELSYAVADQISPCCDYNQRWERRLGATSDRLRTLSYGVDTEQFKPRPAASKRPSVVVWVGRINPLKDLQTLIEAAALVHAGRPDVRFLLFGSATAEDAEYHQELLALRARLGLEAVVKFRGYVAEPSGAYHQGDVVALSSVSEAFPFSILEAMLCGKPVVATAVGGVPEEIDGCGIAVEPRNPSDMSRGLLELLNDADRCRSLGRAARDKAEACYGVEQFTRMHYQSYLQFTAVGGQRGLGALRPPPRLRRVEPPNSLPVQGQHSADQTAAFEALVDVLGRELRVPVDALEITAILESRGVTDQVAQRRYGRGDVFEVGEHIWQHI